MHTEPKYSTECDQLRASISSVHYTKYILSLHQLKDFLHHENLPQLLGEFGSSKISKGQNFFDQAIFKSGFCQKNFISYKI